MQNILLTIKRWWMEIANFVALSSLEQVERRLIFYDALFSLWAWFLAYTIALFFVGGYLSETEFFTLNQWAIVAVAYQMGCSIFCRIFNQSHTTILRRIFLRLLLTNMLSTILLALTIYLSTNFLYVPRSALALYFLFLTLLIGTHRFIWLRIRIRSGCTLVARKP